MYKFQSFKSKIDDMSIRKKLVLSYLFVVVVPLLLVGVLFINGMNQSAINSAMNESKVNAARLQTRMSEIFQIGINVSEALCEDKKMQEIVSKQYTSLEDLWRTYSNFTSNDIYLQLYKQIKTIRLFVYNSTMLDNWFFMPVDEATTKSKWYKETIANDGIVTWNYIHDPIGNKDMIILSRLVKDSSGIPLGVLQIGFTPDYISNIINQEPFDTIISIDNGTIVASKNPKLMGQSIDKLKIDRLVSRMENNNFKTVNYNGEPSVVNLKKFRLSSLHGNFRIFTIFKVSDIVKDSQKVLIAGVSIITASFIIALFFIILFSNAISSRINKLSNEVDRVIAADFDADVTMEVRGKDEIGRLSENIIIMLKNVRKLVYEVYEMDLQKKKLIIEQNEIHFKMLASQINPHFLFNALESVRMKAHNRGEKDIAHILKLFAKMMRRNLEVGNEPVLLKLELEHVSNYLEIQKFRFGERVEYEINTDGDITTMVILPFILQPLVENAFVHGLEDKKSKGKITLNVKAENNLSISIMDNGKGIDEERLSYIIQSLDNNDKESQSRIGIRNVYQRLKLYYGEQFKLSIQSKIDDGTKIDIILPVEDKAYVKGSDNR